MTKSITSPRKLAPESWKHQKDGHPESWDEPPPQKKAGRYRV